MDWDDPAVEEHWCGERRQIVTEYLAKEGFTSHGEVGEWPAWHVTPYVSLWAVESLAAPGHVGWWVICGDLPTEPNPELTALLENRSDLLHRFAQDDSVWGPEYD